MNQRGVKRSCHNAYKIAAICSEVSVFEVRSAASCHSCVRKPRTKKFNPSEVCESTIDCIDGGWFCAFSGVSEQWDLAILRVRSRRCIGTFFSCNYFSMVVKASSRLRSILGSGH